MHDPKDGSIYRQVSGQDGKPYEEFIMCTDRSAKSFIAMHENDFKEWLAYFKQSCTCN